MSDLSIKPMSGPVHSAIPSSGPALGPSMECASHCQLIDFQKQQYEKARLHAIRARMAETEMEYRTREMIDGALYLLQKPLNVVQAMSNNLNRCHWQDKDQNREHHCTPMEYALDEALESGHAAIETLRLSEPDKKHVVHGPVNVNEAIRDCLVIMADDLAYNGIVVDWRAKSDLPMTFGDEIGLRILLRIVLSNAIIAVGQEGAKGRDVSIRSTTAQDGMIEISIHDSGPGIEKSLRAKVFEPFFTAWRGTKHRSGMGLAIAHQILTELHGEMEIRSNGSSGCFLCITMPAC